MKNIAIVLSGGGAKGAFHLGVLAFLEEAQIPIEAYSGSSIGSIISVSHASGVSAREQLKIFLSKDLQQVVKFNYFKKSLLRIDYNNPILKDLLPISNLEDIPKKVFVNAYDAKHKKIHYFDTGDTLNLCLASCALFPIFNSVAHNNMKLIDAGIVDNLPVTPLLNQNYNILSVDVMPRLQRKRKQNFNPIKTIRKKIFKTWHKNANFAISNSDFYISNLAIRNFKMFTFRELNTCFNLGYKDASFKFKKILG